LILLIAGLVLFASTSSAQIAPGQCIEFITDAHGTLVAIADTCRQDTIQVGAERLGGPWVFRGEGGAALSIARGADYAVQDTIIYPGQLVIFEGDTVSAPPDTITVQRMVHVPDTIIFTASSGTGGRTYIYDLRGTAHAGLGNIDSTYAALYGIEWNFGTLNYQGYANFSNNGGGGSDSTQFQMNGLAFYGFMLPTDVAYAVMLERAVIKTSFGSATDATYSLTFPANITSSSDTTLFTAHIKTEYIAGVRNYYLRIYKHHRTSVTGLVVPLASGVLVCSHTIPADRFPAYGTSVQIRLDMWIRRL
jgi:hypothetical protein